MSYGVQSDGEMLLAWPLAQHIITQGFKNHNGIDLRTCFGDFQSSGNAPVTAMLDGTVSVMHFWDMKTKSTKSMESYGNYIEVDHGYYNGKTLVTRYAHLNSFTYDLELGDPVVVGEKLGIAGSTGNSTGPHLHVEVLWGGRRTNPLVWLDSDFTKANSNVYTFANGEHSVVPDSTQVEVEVPLYDISVCGITMGDVLKFKELAQELDVPFNMIKE